MTTFRDIVQKTSEAFLQEAKLSPLLLMDMANMEYYMAESYCGRILIELLQNADDAKSTKVIVKSEDGNLFFGNNGKPFDEQDLIAISRSGASKKQRGNTIGYRGVGFKSATYISNDIVIYSSDTYFTFSKQKCAEILHMDTKDVPTVRVPLLLEEVSHDIKSRIDRLKSQGYSTVFAFLNASIETFTDEIRDVQPGCFIFLKHICECRIDLSPMITTIYNIERFFDKDNQHIKVSHENEQREWMVVNYHDVSIAFLIKNGIIVPCNSSEAVYHCYLPTLDKSIVACKINADFSTDPSRKHLTLDDKTRGALLKVADVFSHVFNMALHDADTGKYKNIFSLFSDKDIFTKANRLIDDELSRLLIDRKWIKLCNGEEVAPRSYKLFPSSFDLDQASNIRVLSNGLASQSLPSVVYENIDSVDKFIGQYSKRTFELDEIVDTLRDREFVSKINSESHIQLITNVIRESRIEDSIDSGFSIPTKEILIKTSDNMIMPIGELAQSNKTMHKEMKRELEERLGDSEIRWLQKQTGIGKTVLKTTQSDRDLEDWKQSVILDKQAVKPHVARWRDAEEKCIQIEELMGNRAEDVSVKNLGYDVLSTAPNGEVRHIEVKSVKRDYAFTLTNNEYTAAHEYGDSFYVCLLCENGEKLDVRYIRNPLVNARFEKRVRQWEWVCLESNYSSQSYELE